MRIDIVMNDLTKLMACADTVTVLRQEHYDLNKNLSQVVPITQDINNLENCAKLIVEECKSKQCKSVVIPFSNSGVKSDPGFSQEFIIALINQESFTEVLLKPADYALETIIIQIDKNVEPKPENVNIIKTNKETFKDEIRKKLTLKKNEWSKARQLSFILDALHYAKKEVCYPHYINNGDYIKYLDIFCNECKEELLIKLKNDFISTYKEDGSNLFEIMTKLSEVEELRKGLKRRYDLFKIIGMDSNYLYEDLRDDFIEQFQYCQPLFYYIRHLIPDKKFRYLNERGIKRVLEDKENIKKDFYHFLDKIIKINELYQCSHKIFPLDLLKPFWEPCVWELIHAEGKDNYKVIKKYLGRCYNVSKDTIHSNIYRKK